MITFIGCDIFREEFEWVLARHPEIQSSGLWLKAGLHNDINLLEEKLNEAFGETLDQDPQNNGPMDLRLLIGNGCLPHMPEIAKTRGLPLLKFKNCLEAILGVAKLRELEQNRTMVITPSWLRKAWFAEDGMRALLGWDNTDFRQNFGRYDRILVLDPGFEPLTDMEILEAFEVIEVPIEVEPLSLDTFEAVITEFFN
ncbi:MAG: DUF1638 domain-containing protein [Deltaproteobacteria bacterium]|jgi:hypothetical protein|nr:DUF1638 domain-containing protein [Deltaproteobacteria bacterium]